MNKPSKRGMQAKKILCLIMAVLLILPTIAQVGMINVRAEEIETESMGEENIRTYEGTGYKITYVVTGSWENHQSIEITLENTGTENINDWSITMDTTGTITGLWNATWQVVNEEQTVIKCQTYNSTILPGSSITFGYTLEGENIKNPENIQLTGIERETNDGYRVEYRTTGEWEGGFQAEITIINESTQPLEGWSLILTGNFTMKSWWNGEVTQNEDGSYTVTHTAWDNSIPVGESRTIGFVGTKSEEELRIDSTKLTVTTWSEATPDEEESKPGEPETQPAEPESNPTEPETKPTEPETNPIVPDEEINWNDETDTDEDGIPDVYEIHMLQTNPESADTDGDGLPDGYEIINLKTAPTIADTDENGIADGKEDTDNDGLDNLTEYELGTNPLNNDSDYDRLTDNNEIQTHKTDPNNRDTDGDGIHDGDEIKLGLSPVNATTNEVPDNQYTVSQSIDEASPVLEEINASINNPYKLSLDIKASGVAENSITVQRTTENELFQNEAYIGELISIDYKDTLKVETLRLNFHMDEGVLENEIDLFGDETTELKGIRRFNVFKFVEGANMLLPIETYHDTEQNIVCAETDEDGIYYLVDMEKWLYGLESELEQSEEPEPYSLMNILTNDTTNIFMSINGVANQEETVVNGWQGNKDIYEDFYNIMNAPTMLALDDGEIQTIGEAEKDHRPIDIVYILQTQGNDKYIGSSWILPYYWSGQMEREYDNIRVCILEHRLDGTYSYAGKDEPYWFTDAEEREYYLERIDFEYTNETFYRTAFNLILGENMGFRKESTKFVIDIPYGVTQISNTEFLSCLNEMEERGIYYSEIHDNDMPYAGYTSVIKKEVEETGGRLFNLDSMEYDLSWYFLDYFDEVMSKIVAPQKEFKAVVATGYEEITLLAPLNSEECIDSDYDELLDWDEVNVDLLHWNADGSIELPTLLYCIENYSQDSYVIHGLDRFKQDVLNNATGVPTNTYDFYVENILRGIKILPIHSNPVAVDGDNDGISDYEEVDIGTNRLLWDTDNDGLSDGFEVVRWYDPLTADGDFDEYSDKEEFLAGTDPYCYNKEWDDYVWDFVYGATAGDFIREPESIAVVMGQVFGGFFTVADVRDLVANLVYGDYVFAGLNAVGLTPVLGDIGKAAANVSRYVARNVDDLVELCQLFTFINRYCPELVPELGKTDDFIYAVKNISKTDNIKLTKEQAKILTEVLDASGTIGHVARTSTNLNVKDTIKFVEDVWELPPVVRGKEIDNLLNQFTEYGLGANFPVVDRLVGTTLVSTKSIDLGLQSYQDANKLKRTLNKYLEKLNSFEGDYFSNSDEFVWNGQHLLASSYDKKVLEIVVPDTLLTDEMVQVLNDFEKSAKMSGIEVWYVIGKVD